MRSAIAGLLAGLTLVGASGRTAARAYESWVPRGADVFDTLADNAWYLPTADGKARLFVTEIGRGPAVVVLHGGSGADFNYLVDAVRPAAGSRRFILFDQRGSVLSPVRAETSSISLDTLVDDLETLRVATGQEKLVLFAHSAGSLVAMRYYERHPDRVAKLILTGSFAPFTPIGGFQALIRDSRRRAKALMARPLVAATLKAEGLEGPPDGLSPRQRSARDRIVGFADFDLVHVERWRKLQGGGVFYNAEVDDAVGASLRDTYDVRPTLKRHPVPIALVQGEQDYVDPGAQSWRGVSAEVHVVKGASHYAWIDNPSGFEAAVLQSLGRDATAAVGWRAVAAPRRGAGARARVGKRRS